MSPMDTDSEDILRFWFGDDLDSPEEVARRSALWFASSSDFDRQLRERFDRLPDRAARGDFAAWVSEPRPTLALVLILDQLPRNLFRGERRAFQFDRDALATALAALDAGHDRRLHPVEASFLYLPLEHAEDLTLQDRCVELFERLARRAPSPLADLIESFTGYARRHGEVIRRFGRFPHRNAVLGRPSTPAERTYLEAGGERF